uniref:DUF4175 family protein n=1 Tax=Schlesneria paludicola TaxID=360056 RepID=A0A7C2JZM2_9PLAN
MSASHTVVELPPDVDQALKRLRSQIRRYVCSEGLALVAVLLGLLFWGSFLADAAYFQLSRLELPRWLRAAFLIGTVGLLAAAVTVQILFRVLTAFRRRALALVIERRFPELGDGLITAVEAAEGGFATDGPFEQALLQRTTAEAARRLERLDLTTVFDPQPLRRAVVVATVLLVSILGLAVVDSSGMERWLSGYLALRPTYWPRETTLVVYAVTQPGEKRRDFRDGWYRHPRGGDLELRIEAAEGTRKPERVRLDYRLAGGSRKRIYLTALGDQPFVHVFPALLDDVEFRVTGGDFAVAEPWRVEVVDPPRTEAVTLSVRYPNYTGLNSGPDTARTTLPMIGTQMSLPMGTDVEFSAQTNKPLSVVRLDIDAGSDRFEIEFGQPVGLAIAGSKPAPGALAGWVTVRSQDGAALLRAAWPAASVGTLLQQDRRGFRLPFVLRPNGAAELTEAVAAAAARQAPLPVPLPWPADGRLRIHLEDHDGIGSPEPLMLTLNGIVDQPPTIEVELKGIGAAITRQARIPVAGLIRDDYGIVQVRFDYVVSDGPTDWQPRELASPPQAGAREFHLARSESEPYERFDVLPLDLQLKQKLTLSVAAVDGDTLDGANEQRSQKFVFTVVPVEELLSLLYAKELNLRKRFEQILTELKDLRSDLELHAGKADEARGLSGKNDSSAVEARKQLELAIATCAERSLLAIRKSASETTAIAVAFADIRDELVNNAAETPQNMDRLETKILGELARAEGEDFPAVDAALGLFALRTDKGQDPRPAIGQSRDALDTLIARLERVLLEMRKLETFHEALELLKSIISAQDELSEETKRQRKEKALRALE